MRLAAEGRRTGRHSIAAAISGETVAVAAPLPRLSLRLNFSWVLAGNLVRAVCRYGMLLLLVRFCGLAAAGSYALAVAVCTPIWAIVLLGLRGALITDARHEYCFGDYLAVRLIASTIGLGVVAGVIVLGEYDRQASVVIGLVAAAKLIEGISDIFRGRLQQQERMDRVSIALVIQGLAGLALMLVFGWLGGGLAMVVAASPLAMALTFVFWDLPCYTSMGGMADGDGDLGGGLFRRPLRWSALGRLSIVAAPIAVAGVLLALIPQLPKYVIDSVLGAEAVAVYTLIAYWITLGMMVVMALGNAVAPRLARYHAAGEARAFARLLVRLVLLVAAMGATGMVLAGLFGPKLAAILGHGNSDLPRFAFALSAFATALYVTGPLGRALAAMRRFWAQTAILAVGVIVAIAVLPWAVDARGLTGAAEAMTFSMGVIALLTGALVWRELSRQIRRERTASMEAVA